MKWNDIPTQVQTALIEWYNVRKLDLDLDGDDGRLLADFYSTGKFWFWNCPVCGEACRWGEPESWSDFQGVSQNDYTSYPGEATLYNPEALVALCDTCRRRAYHIPEGCPASV